QTSGGGIFKSMDAGKTWECMGLIETKTIHRIIIHRDEPNTVFVAALGSPWGPNKERGVFKTTDGGLTWKNILYNNDETGCADLVVDPSNPNKLFASMWEFGRKPWTFNSGGKGSGLYVSHDGGNTWKKRTDKDGLPEGPLGRIGLAVAASDPNIVYALVESKEVALYKSTDGGVKWSEIGTENVGNRPFYYADIFVNPQDAKEVWSLWSMVSRSDDGGRTFDVVIPYSGVHPDHHAFWIHPEDPSLMMDGNDGGFNISRDGGSTWEYITNLPLGQFYHINYDMEVPYNVYGGMQDNGSWQGPGYVWHGGGIRNEDWKEISFGDGFDVVPYKGEGNFAYSMWQGGNLMETDVNTGQSRYIQPLHPEGEKLRFNWNAAIAQDPFNENGLYFGSQYVHRTTDCGDSWKIISPDLTTNDSLKQKQAESGGLSLDVTGAENHTTILCISPSTLKKDVIWVGTDDGNIQLSKDAGVTWTNVAKNIKGAPSKAWVPQIELSSHNEGEAFVVINNYRQNDWKPYVYHTTDYGTKWVLIADENNVTGHALSIVQDPISPDLIFLGTENGLYVSFDHGKNWNAWKHDYPSVSTIDLKIHPREGDLIIGTFGRAAYILDDISPLREAADKSYEIQDTLSLFQVPDAYLAQYKRPDGMRFPGDHHWSGENRSSNARVSYHVVLNDESNVNGDEKSDEKEEETAKPLPKKIKVYALSLSGDTLRKFSTTPDSTGVNRFTWNLSTDGVRFPSRKEREKTNDGAWGGPKVAPGTYKIVMEWGMQKDSALVNVLADPRLGHDQEAYLEKIKQYDRFNSLVQEADNGFEWTKSALKTMKRVETRHELVEDSLLKDLNTMGDSIRKELTAIQDLYMLPEGVKGYHDDSDLLMTYIWQGRSYIDNGRLSPGPNTDLALEITEKQVAIAMERIKDLKSDAWIEWKELVDEIESSPFDEEIELE
ncbi:MAG: photosystem II stability/assembly factor-like uncharacterized protein, partial [Flavobacteriales bacterium]